MEPAKKKNYHSEMEKIIKQISDEKLTNGSISNQKLLLHACCGPCSSYVIELLAQVFDITIYYYNPNIHPQQEYERRLEELKKFLTQFPVAVQNKVSLVADEYNPEDFFTATNVLQETELQTEHEKGERCRRCYKFRMERSYDYAVKNNFDWFTTTLSISPHKDSEKINNIGNKLEENAKSIFENLQNITKFLPSDFKKKGGFLRSTQLSSEYGLWRQDYCGCVYSKQNMN